MSSRRNAPLVAESCPTRTGIGAPLGPESAPAVLRVRVLNLRLEAGKSSQLAHWAEAAGPREVHGVCRHHAGELSPADGQETPGVSRDGGQVRQSWPPGPR